MIGAKFAVATAIAVGLTGGAAAVQQSGQDATVKKTVTGCIERADQLLARDALGTTVDSQTFVLVPAEEMTATAPVGTAGANAGANQPPLYRLEGADDALNEHVGHRVEIQGVMSPPIEAPTASGARQVHLVRVEAVKMIAETCQQKDGR